MLTEFPLNTLGNHKRRAIRQSLEYLAIPGVNWMIKWIPLLLRVWMNQGLGVLEVVDACERDKPGGFGRARKWERKSIESC